MRLKTSKIVGVFFLVLVFSLACKTLAPSENAKLELKVKIDLISTGGAHSCAIANGTVYCWGYNGSGQLGDGTLTNRNTANLVPGLNNIISISAGGHHTCALLNSGDVKCWGDNYSWQLGDGTNKTKLAPDRIVQLNGKAIAISAGSDHTCALMSNREVKCWGKNLHRQLGIDSNERIGKLPETVKDLQGVIMVSAGSEHTCALLETGDVKCWGANQGNDARNVKTPVDVLGLNSNIVSITTSFASTCALENSGNVWCWGLLRSVRPERVRSFNGKAINVVMGTDHVCIITNNGAVECTGENEYGQLGDGTTNPSYTTASQVNLPGKVVEVTANFSNTCALIDNGNVLCWGENSEGQLGNGSFDKSATPVTVIGLK